MMLSQARISDIRIANVRRAAHFDQQFEFRSHRVAHAAYEVDCESLSFGSTKERQGFKPSGLPESNFTLASKKPENNVMFGRRPAIRVARPASSWRSAAGRDDEDIEQCAISARGNALGAGGTIGADQC